jgi:hypothetical protein
MRTTTRLALLATFGSALTLSSCSTGGHSPSGFLSNYKQLDAGYGTANAVSSYVKPGVDFKKYDSVIIDPVTTIVGSPGVDSKVTDQLAAYLSDALHQQVIGELKVVSVPGPTTLRVRMALTDVIEGQKAGTPVTVVHTGTGATLTGTLGSADVAAFISKVSFEGEVLDSLSGDRLLANIDHRIGSKREASATTSWASVRSAVNQGVERLNKRFLTLRAR